MQVPFGCSPGTDFQPCKVLVGASLRGRLSTKSRVTNWELVAFKVSKPSALNCRRCQPPPQVPTLSRKCQPPTQVELEVVELTGTYSRRDVFMLRNFARAVAAGSDLPLHEFSGGLEFGQFAYLS